PSLGGGIALDSAGNLFIPDQDSNRVRRVDAVTGIITTVAGTGIPGFAGDGNLAVNAKLLLPSAVAVDAAGNLFIADTANNSIRKVDAKTRIITTVVGNGMEGYNGDSRPATSASIDLPFTVIVDRAGNLIIADTFNRRIRAVDSNGTIRTLAGNGQNNFSGDGGPATGAGLSNPVGVAVDGLGNLIISDQLNQRIRRVGSDGIIRTIAGKDTVIGDGGLAIDAQLSNPFSAMSDASGNIIMADSENNRIRRVDMTTGIITTIAGNGI